MQPPEAFIRFASLFHQDVLVIYGTMENAAKTYVEEMSRPDLRAVDIYIADVLGDETKSNSLKNTWRKLGPDFRFRSTKAARAFFQIVHALVKTRLEARS